MSVYTSLNLQKSQDNVSMQLPKQSLPTLKPKATNEESVEPDVEDTTNPTTAVWTKQAYKPF